MSRGPAIAAMSAALGLAAAGCLTASQESRLQTDMAAVRQQVFQMQKETAALLAKMETIELALSQSESASPTRFADLESLLQSLADQVRELGARLDDNTARMSALTQEIAMARQQYRALDARLAAAIATRGLSSGSGEAPHAGIPPAGAEPPAPEPGTRTSEPARAEPSRSPQGVGSPTSPAPPSPSTAPPPPAAAAPPALAGVGAIGGEGDVAGQEAAFRTAYADYTKGSYESALIGFQEFLKRHPGSPLAEGAHYYAGDCLFSQQKYEEASEAFTVVIEKYPSSDRAPAAHLKKGLALLALKQTARGVIQLQHVIETYPRSEEAKVARERLRQLGLTVR